MLIGETDPEKMRPAQRAAYDQIASGPRGGVPFPFLAMLDAPQFAAAIQGVGEAIRYHGVLDDRLREIAILAAAAAWGSGYEWAYHDAIAARLGMTPDERGAVLDGSARGLAPAEALCVRYIRAAVLERRADQDLLAGLVAALGREAATEITTIAGYYPLLALFLSAGQLDSPLPERIAA
ncbi:carboxymuconolactone decarboxylase family protein [Pseudogemmobacter humi]|uniref:Carboxymuconolactone decarboxylase family protein n=1 Tax=Pseudogemmobacter humi TaxID=2483812 RepID=A0A3P5WNE6_9RHOB|nr:carboxymuconolactone decarboxylase family protein [Pseudogemmobacter humi]VDC25003.1 Carboxymuconolactone decarboxylase family protein [Pseudogemmobacter humi]